MSLLLSGDDGASKVDIAAFNSTGTAPQYVCRAWVNFNGTGTVAIRESGNVSSITDNSAGNYTINFTTAMPHVNYMGFGTTSSFVAGSDVSSPRIMERTVNSVGVECWTNGSIVDSYKMNVGFIL